MSLYSDERWLLFVLFVPCVLMTSAVLLAWSLLGLLLFVPGVFGLSGIAGLLLGWIGLIAPRFAVRHRGLIGALLVMKYAPETKGLTLEQIQERLAGDAAAAAKARQAAA